MKKMAWKHLESRSPMLLSHHRVKKKTRKKNTVSRSAFNFGSGFKKFFGHVGLAEHF